MVPAEILECVGEIDVMQVLRRQVERQGGARGVCRFSLANSVAGAAGLEVVAEPRQSLLQHFAGNQVHQAQALGTGNEAVGHDDPVFRVVPAQQRLEAGQSAVAAVHFGLIGQSELVALQGQHQLSLGDHRFTGGERRTGCRCIGTRADDQLAQLEAGEGLRHRADDIQAVFQGRALGRPEDASAQPADHDDLSRALALGQPAHDLDPIHVRHHHVQGDEFGHAPVDFLEKRAGCGRDHRFQPNRADYQRHGLRHIGLVVEYDNTPGVHG